MPEALIAEDPLAAADTAGAPPEAAPRAATTRPPFGFLAIIGALTFGADVLSKLWASRALSGPDVRKIDVVAGHLDFLLRHNGAGAWSLFETAPLAVRRPFFIGVSVAAVAGIVFAYRRLRADDAASRWGFALVLGGALGNLLDRIRDSSVVDFIHAHAAWGGVDHEWPVFNVADVAICAGVALLFVGLVRHGRRAAS